MKMGWISYDSFGKLNLSTEKTFDRQLSVGLINSIFLIFIITMKILNKSKMK